MANYHGFELSSRSESLTISWDCCEWTAVESICSIYQGETNTAHLNASVQLSNFSKTLIHCTFRLAIFLTTHHKTHLPPITISSQLTQYAYNSITNSQHYLSQFYSLTTDSLCQLFIQSIVIYQMFFSRPSLLTNPVCLRSHSSDRFQLATDMHVTCCSKSRV